MASPFTPPNQPNGDNVSPLAVWIQNILKALTAAFNGINSAKVLPPVVFETGAVATGTNSNMPAFTDTVPTNTQGDQYMSATITPTNAGSTLIIDIVFQYGTSAASNVAVALFQDATANALACMGFGSQVTLGMISFRHKMTAGTTSPTTFKVRAGMSSAGTLTFNGFSGTRSFGGVMASSITITEILP